MSFITAKDGTNLFYNDWGSGKPVVLVHGWPLNSDMWEYQSPVLAEAGLRMVAYDRRGFGRSGQPWTGYDYDTMSDDLATIIDALDLRDVTLVGFSMGGGEVARYLARHGAGRIARAALVAAVTPYLLKTEEHPDGAPKSLFDGFVEKLRADRPSFLGTFGKQFFGASLLNFSVSGEILHWATFMALQASPKATIDCVRAFSETDFRRDMAAFTVPTLIVHGASDQTVPPDISARPAAALVANSTLKIYEGAPHALTFTHKDQLNADLLEFIRS